MHLRDEHFVEVTCLLGWHEPSRTMLVFGPPVQRFYKWLSYGGNGAAGRWERVQ